MAGLKLKSLERSEVKDVLNGIDTILCDCDGVLCNMDKVVADVPETVKQLKKSKKGFFYVTNNPNTTRQRFSRMLNSLGYETEPENIICAAHLVATYLKSINFSRQVYVIGYDSITEELDAMGIKSIGPGPETVIPDMKTTILCFEPDEEIGAVVVSFDEYFNYLKLMKAVVYLSNPNVLFIATSMDTQIPFGKISVPGPGGLVKAIEYCSGRTATVLGKPELYVRKAIIDTFDVVPERTLMIGDNVHTDILMGKRCGFKTLLVLTGVTKEEDIEAWKDPVADTDAKGLIPDFYTDSLADIKSYL